MTTVLRISGAALVAAVWISAAFFGAYIIAFYAGALLAHAPMRWNDNLPGLYAPGNFWAAAGIAVHFAAGGIILLLGPIQLFGAIRSRWPALHRWIGRVYVLSAFLAGLGGLVFIAAEGTIGGRVMNIGFGLYGALMVLASVQAYRYARARRFERHRAWAIRLFALAIGSWLYRMDYGFWLMLTHGLGHTGHFTGPFDHVMAFFFYVPNLIVAEFFIRGTRMRSPLLKAGAALVLACACMFLAVGTYYFARYYWAPGIETGLDALGL